MSSVFVKPTIEICEKRYKTTICQNTKEIKFYTSGTHNSSSLVYKKHGLTPAVKEIIEDLIHNYDNKPKRLHIRLHKKHILPKVDIMPSLKQVQDYIKNRRAAIGDNNNIDELKEFLKELCYIDDVTPDSEFFQFGSDMGNGSDSEHFHLGFTSLQLLKNIEFLNQTNKE